MSYFKHLALLSSAFFVSQVFAHPTGLDLSLSKRQQQDPSTPLFLNSPSCNFFQCAVDWYAGDQATVNWLNAPNGGVRVFAMTNASAVVAWEVATAPSVDSACDAGNGPGVSVPGTTCGGFVFVVPSSWANGNYTMMAQSMVNPNQQSFTDVILIKNNDTSPKNVDFKLISGKIDSSKWLTSISAPESTSSTSSAMATSSASTATPSHSSKTSSSSSSVPSSTPSGDKNSADTLVHSTTLATTVLAMVGLALLL